MERLRVVTLNIWNRMGPWEQRLQRIREGLEQLRPDIVGLQEILSIDTEQLRDDQARQIARDLDYEVVATGGKELGGGLSFGNALLTRYPVLEHGAEELPGANESDQVRSVIHALLDTPCGKVHVFVTHLNWKLHEGAIRARQVQRIAELVAERAPVRHSEYPPILLGDFNAEPESDEIRYLKGLTTFEGKSVFFADCWAWAGDGGPGWTFDPRNPYAAESHEPPRRIDYIFLRGPDKQLRGKPLSCRVVFDAPRNGVWPSDHFGVMADLATP